MNKADLVEEVSAETGLTKRASGEAIGAVIDGITDALARGERVTLVGFGTLRVRDATVPKKLGNSSKNNVFESLSSYKQKNRT